MVFEFDKLKQRTRLFVDEALSAVKAGFSDDDANLRPLELTQLEQRILMSASPMAVVAEAVDTPAPEVPSQDEVVADLDSGSVDAGPTSNQDNNVAAQATVELVVIDPSAENHEQLVADIQSQTDREFEILILDPREDGISQITDALRDLRDVSAIHLVSHGDEGEILLGASVLSQRNIGRYAAELVTWQQSMTADADLLIYGCDLTASEEGLELTESLNTLLGADVAASDDLTGHADLGGDWEFETIIGTVESDLAFSITVQQEWSGLLALDGLIVSTFGDVGSPSGAPGLDAWTDGAALKFGGANLDLGSGTTNGSFSEQFDLSDFVDDGNADIDGLHYVSRDILVGGAGGIQLFAGDILFSTEGTESANGGALTFRTEDVGLFRPDTVGDLTSGTVSMLLEDLSIKTGFIVGPAVHGFTLIEQTTTVGDVTLNAGDFLYTNLNDFEADDIMLFETSTVGDGNTSGSRSKLLNGVDLGFAGSAYLFGIELIEEETTIGGTTLSAGTILVQASGNQTGLGINNISSSAHDIIALELTTTEIGSGNSSGEASIFFRGSDVGLDSGSETIDAIALSTNNVPVADIGGPYTIAEGESLSLDGSSSSDPDSDTLVYRWDINNDGVYGDTNEPTTATSTLDWATLQSLGIDDDGAYTIGLQVDDGKGGVSATTASVTVNNSSPVLSTTGAGNIGTGSVYTLNLASTDAGDDTITSWTINWGDGTIETIAGNPSTATHTYTGAGHTYNILASATDEDGTWIQNELIAPSYNGDTVFRFAATTGDFLQKFATNEDTDAPVAAIIGPDGLLYVSSETSNDVLRYNAETGAFIDVFVAPGEGGLQEAQGIAFGADGHLYVADYSQNRVKRFDGTSGAFINDFVTNGSGGLNDPYALTFGPDGSLYVSSYTDANVLRFDGQTGASVDTFVGNGLGGLSTPEALVFGPDGNLYVSSADTDSVLRFNGSTGVFIDSFVSTGSGGLDRPGGLAFGPDGNLYVGNLENGAIHRYNGITGAYIDDYVTAGAGGFDAPASIAFVPGHQVTVTTTPPTITSDGGGATATVNVSETDLAVTTVAVSDPDLPFQTLSYSLSGADAARFTISSTGVLTFAAPQDFENPTDTNTDNRYEVTVEVNDGIASDTQAITVIVSDVAADVTGELWFTTSGNGDATGLSWTHSEVVQFGDSPDLFDTATGVTSGTFSKLPGFDAPANIRAMHYVESDLRIGSEPNHFDVTRGDLILVLDATALNDTDGDPGNDLAVDKVDIVVYRPDAVSDYSSGEYYLLLEDGVRDPSNTTSPLDINAIALVERDTVVGGTTLTAGTFLVTHKNPGHENIGTFTITGTGENSSSSVVQTLLTGASLGNSGTKVQGLHLLQQETEFNGTVLAAGTLLTQVENSGTLAGVSHDEYDVIALTVTQTEQDGSPGSAAAGLMLFDGSDVQLDAGSESLNGFTVVSSSFPQDVPAATDDSYQVNEDSVLSVTPETADLQNHWEFNSTSGQTLNDSGALGNDATLGASAATEASDPTYSNGHLGSGGLSFDGTNDFVSTNSSVAATSASFTLSSWFQAGRTTGQNHLLWQGYSGGNGFGDPGFNSPASSEMGLSIGTYNQDNKVVFFLGYDVPENGADSIYIVSASDFTDTSDWHHVAVTVEDIGGGVMQAFLYVDGVLEGTDTGVQNDRSNWGDLRIGSTGASTRFFDGQLDDVRVYDNSLSADQVSSLALSGVLRNDILNGGAATAVTTNLTLDAANGSVTLNNDGTFEYTPDLNFFGTDTFKYTVTEGGQTSSEATVTVTVDPTADAPVLSAVSGFQLDSINENDTGNPGTLVSDILGSVPAGAVSDSDGDSVGIAVTSVDDTNGTWEYSVDGGTSWTAFGAVSQNSAVVLGAGSQDRVRFVPDLDVAGAESFTFRAWDGSDGNTSGATGVNASVIGGGTAFSVNTGTATVPIVSVNVVLNFATVGDVTDSGGAPGLNSWSNSEIIVLGDPNFEFEPNTSGTLFKTYDLNDYTGGTDISIEALHEVSTNITVGGVNGTVDLVEGDILFAAPNNSVTYTGLDSVGVSAGMQDVVRFRPSDQTFALVFDEIGAPFVNGFTLIEKDVTVGDTDLSRGDVLLNIGNNRDILLVDVVGAGAGNSVGSSSILVAGSDIGMGDGVVNIAGIDLIEEDLNVGGFTLRAGQIAATLDGDDTDVGDNNITVLASDIFLLDVTTTSLGPTGTTAATATVMLEGSDLNLESSAELLTALSYTVNFGVRNEPILTFSPGSPTFSEDAGPILIDDGASVSDVDSANFDGGLLRVEIASNGTANDTIAVRNQGTGANQIGVSGADLTFEGSVIGTFTGGGGANPLVVALNGNANELAVTALLQNLTFDNSSQAPFTGDRSIRFSMTDGDGSSSEDYFRNVSVIATNDSPVAVTGSYAITEGANLLLDASASSDPDNSSLTFEWDLNYDGVTFSADATGETPTVTWSTLFDSGIRSGDYTIAVRASDGSLTSPVATSTLAVTALPATTINQTTSTINIDGNIDAAWAESTPINLTQGVGAVDNPADLSANWRSSWDADNLYFLVDVQDETIVTDSGTQAWEDDVVVLYIDADNSRRGTYDSNDFELAFRVDDPSTVHVGLNSATDTTGVQFTILKNGSGYVAEVSVPWTTLGVTPAAGNNLGFEVHVGDDDDGGARDTTFVWTDVGTLAFGDTSVFGKIELAATTTSTIVVDTTEDTADGDTSSIAALYSDKGADGKISLREAIIAANATANGGTPDRILFDISDPLISGAHTINLTSALPDIDQQLIIDGTTEGDYAGSPVIVLDGSAAGAGAHGFRLSFGSDGSTIRGLAINQFAEDGIRINASDNHTIVGNYIGTDAGGVLDLGNGRDGIFLSDSNGNTIGTSSAADRNVIVGNVRDGIRLSESNSNVIRGNYVGLAADGIQNAGHDDDGIHLSGSSSANIIGGSGAGDGNVIVSSSNNGIELGGTTANNTISGNFIGVTTGGAALGNSNSGIRFHTDSTSNTIGGINSGEGNQIANNGGYGISTSGNAALPTANIQIVGNAIFANGGLGIDVEQNGLTIQAEMPDIASAEVDGTNLTVTGTLNGTAGATYQLAFYASASADPTGYGEAERFLGTIDVTIDGSGAPASFDQTIAGAGVSVDEFVTATARTAGRSTTEFAENVQAVAVNVAPVAQISPLLSLREGQDLAIDGSGSTDANSDTLTYRWDLNNDGGFGQTNEPTSATATVTWSTLQTFGITGPGTYTIGLEVNDGRGGIDSTTATVTVTPPLGTTASVVLSTAADTSTGGTADSDAWTRGTVVELGDPNLSLTPSSTAGTFSSVFNIDDFAADGDVDINGLHYVTSNLTVGSANSIDLQIGDVLFSTNRDESFNGGTLATEDSDVVLFRPDAPGDYSSGTFSVVLSDLSSVTGFFDPASTDVDIIALTLVEKDTLIGDEIVNRGDFLYTKTEDAAGANDIYVFRTSGVGVGTTDGTSELLIRGSDIGISQRINGLEVVEETITIGGQTLAVGELLVSTNSDQTGVGSTSQSFARQDIFRVTVGATTLNAGTATGTATAFVTGDDVGLDSGAEEVNALSLAGFAMNSAPTASIAAFASISEGEGLSLDGSGSTDSDGDGLNYEWDLAYNGSFSADFTTDSVNLTWSQLTALGIDDDGDYQIALRVNDGSQNSTLETVTLTVTDVAPTISLSGDTQAGEGQSYTVNLNYSDVGNDSVTSWTVNWGDGSIETLSGSQLTATHVYTNAGHTNNITYTVTDDDGTYSPSTIVVTSTGSNRVYFNSNGVESAVGVVSAPAGIVQGPDGLLYIANFGSNDIDRVDPVTGTFVDSFVIPNVGGLDDPTRLAFGPDGSLYVTSNGSGQVLRFGNDGRFLGEFLSGINGADGIAFDQEGNVYISSSATGDIWKYDARTGTQIGTAPFASFGAATFMDLNFGPNGNLYAASTTANLIREFDADGNTVGDFSGGALTDVTTLAGFTFGPNGNLYAVDFGGGRVVEYAPDGTLIGKFGNGLTNPTNVLFSAALQVTVNGTPTVAGESYNVDEGDSLSIAPIADWASPSWKQRQQISIDNSSSASSFTNFPVLVKLHASATDAINIDYGDTRDGGEDLRFVDADGTLLKHEVESWDESGYSYVWVQVPTVDANSSNDFIWMYFDHVEAADGHDQTAVWNSDYQGVYHLNGTSIESTSNANHGAIADVVVQPGIVANAGSFNGSTSRINLGSNPVLDDVFAGGGTVSAWINPESSGENGYGRIFDKASSTFGGGANADGWALQVAEVGSASGGYLIFEQGFTGGQGEWRTPAGSISQDNWQSVALVYDNSSSTNDPQIYIDGVLQTLTRNRTPSGAARSDAALNLTVGNHSVASSRTFDGLIDEVRIASTEISAEQLAAEYENVTGNFLTQTGTVETGPGGLLNNESDAEGDPLTVSLVTGPANSSSFSLNPDGSFNYVHDGSETTSDSFTYTVSDGTTTSAPVTVNLTVAPQNDAPVVSALTDITIPEDTTAPPRAFTISDAETASSALTVTAVSNDQSIIPNSGLTIQGTGANRTISITPAANAFGGPVTISIRVSDGLRTTVSSFEVEVTPSNDDPTISAISDVTIDEDQPQAPIAFTIGDSDSNLADLVVTATSSDQSLIADANISITGTGANRSISFVPVPNANGGPATITINVSDGVGSESTTFGVTINAVNDAPVLSAITDQTVAEDTELGPINFSLADIDNTIGDLVVSATSADQALIADGDIILTGTGASRQLRLTPQANATGTTRITLTLSDGGPPVTREFDVTVTPVDDPPTIGVIGNIETPEDTPSPTVSFDVGDIDSAPAAMSISARSTDQSLVADSDIVLGGSGPNRTISYTPVANAFGEVEIVVTVSDGTTSVDRTFKAVVTPVNDEPTISAVADQNIDEDTTSAVLPFTIGDVETSSGALVVTAASSDQTLIADGDIVIAGTGANRSVQFTPVQNAFGGPVTITLSVSDGTATTTETFDVTINAVNDVPVVGSIPDVPTQEDTPTGTFTFSISDVETSAGALVVTAVSDDQSLVADAGITLGGTGIDRTISITPVANANGGPATITVSVSDGVNTTQETFRIRVTPVNDAPVVSAIPDVTTAEDTAVGPFNFTVNDVETAAGALTVTATSNSQSLVRDADIVIGGTGQNRTISLTPAPNANGGPATITVTVSDGATTTTQTFDVTITPVNDAPTVATIPDVTIDEDTTAGPYTFRVGDVDNVDDGAGPLTVIATSSNQSLIADSGIVLTGTGANRTIEVTPLANAFGTSTISVVVSDGILTTTTTFEVTVNSVNDLPEIDVIPNATTAEDTAIGPYAFSIGDVETASTDLVLTATSSDQDLVSDADITLGGTAGNRTISITPRPDANGTVTIQLSLSDGIATTTQTFNLTVTPVNDAPTITEFADLTIDEDEAIGPISYSVRDVDDINRTLIVSAASSNQDLIADGDILLTGTGTNRELRFRPVEDQFGGPVTITVSVTDGEFTTETDFVVNVSPVNDAPERDSNKPFTFDVEDNYTLEVTGPGLLAGVTDVENDAISAVLVTKPEHGELNLNADGTFTYVADVGLQGAVTFEFYATDGQANSDIERVSLVLPMSIPLPAGSNVDGPVNIPETTTETESTEESQQTSEETSETTDETIEAGPESPPLSAKPEENSNSDDEEFIPPPVLQDDEEEAAVIFNAVRVVDSDGAVSVTSGSSVDLADAARVLANSLSFEANAASLDGLSVAGLDAGNSVFFTSVNYESFSEVKGAVDQIEQLKETLDSKIDLSGVVVNTAAVTATGVMVSAVVTAIRTGVLALGFLTQLPIWTMFDPLMVMDGASGEEGDSLQEIVDRNAREAEEKKKNDR